MATAQSKKFEQERWNEDPQRDRLHDRRRQMIIRAAARIFADKGYDKASIDDVAEALNVSKPTIYYYLKGKENLLVEVVMLAVEQLDEIAESKHPLNGLERVNEFLGHYVESLLDDLGRCMTRNLSHISRDESVARVRDAQRQLHQRLFTAVLAGIKDGSIVAKDAAVLTQAIFGAYNSIPRWFDPAGPHSVHDVHRLMMETFCGGIAEAGPTKANKRKATAK